jgi:hypothetical protein
MTNDGHICIQESIHTILRASLLVPVKLPTPNRTRYAFLPANIGERVDGYQALAMVQSFTVLIFNARNERGRVIMIVEETKHEDRTCIVVSWLSGSH